MSKVQRVALLSNPEGAGSLAELPRIRAPLTVVYAVSDPQGRAAVDRSFRSAYARAAQARFVRIDGSGHMVMYDQPARLAAAIREFLR